MRWKIGLVAAAFSTMLAAPSVWAQDPPVSVQFAGTFASRGPGGLAKLQKRVMEWSSTLSGGSLDFKFFEPGSLASPRDYLDRVGDGSIDMAYTLSGIFTHKDIAFALYSSVPFGPEYGEYHAWMRHGGGDALMKELHRKYNVEVIACGPTAPEASGWFRKEIKTVDDLKGLRMRIYGLGANVMRKLGVETATILPGEVITAFREGKIDAAELALPALDLAFGFHEVAKHYYFPGWHQPATYAHLYVSARKWQEFSPRQKAAVQAACDMVLLQDIADSEADQPAALREIQGRGVTLHRWSPVMLAAFREAWAEVAKEQAASSVEFKRGWASLSTFRENFQIWRTYSAIRE
jgi:TRAP-type mannitol/chloroaromatic compound transport system substrate-binding protein